MKHFVHLQLLVLMIVALCSNNMWAQDHNSRRSFAQALESPVVKDKKIKNEILEYQARVGKILFESGKNYNVTLENDVIKIIIPADLLFEPNSTSLSNDAEEYLQYYANRLRVPGLYNMVLAMYHDNTGSPRYCQELTDQRIQSIYDWFVINSNAKYVSYFSFGDKDPMLDNNSINNRRMNRRLEIYLVPGPTMIDQAKRNLLR